MHFSLRKNYLSKGAGWFLKIKMTIKKHAANFENLISDLNSAQKTESKKGLLPDAVFFFKI